MLLERLGDFQGAFDLLFNKLQEAIQSVSRYLINNKYMPYISNILHSQKIFINFTISLHKFTH